MCNKMLLRYEAVFKGNVWVATCLELGIIVSSTADGIRDAMAKAVELYVDGLEEATRKGFNVAIIGVRHYWLRRLRFDVRKWLLHLTAPKSPKNMLWQKERNFAC